MEDEDGESKVVDMWNLLGEQQFKDTSLGNSLKSSIDSSYSDIIEEEKKQLLRHNSIASKESPGKNNGTGSKIVFKGFKKRILAQAQETQTNASRGASQELQSPHSNASSKNSKEKRAEIKRGKITEYAQYLGLQPSLKNKCLKCHTSSNLCPILKQNLCTCNSTMTPMPSTSESSAVPHPANFKITRKVYLCAACGTYFENWNLFLHMRDIHKRHICLFCLGMFGQAERLSYHLTKNHSVPEMSFTSVEDFYGAFKGSCYLVCCTCEKVFSETDNFYNHFCSPASRQDATASICTLCRQTGLHASTCSLAVSAGKEVNSTVPPFTQTGATPTNLFDRTVNTGSKCVSRKSMKNNRSKHTDEGEIVRQKVHACVRKTSNKSASRSNESPTFSDNTNSGESPRNVRSAVKDTVSETIMEVSKCVEDPCEGKEEASDKEPPRNDLETVRSTDATSRNSYDSVIETIMEVSRCTDSVQEPRLSPGKEEASLADTADLVDADKTPDKRDTEVSCLPVESDGRTNELDAEHRETEKSATEDGTTDAAIEARTDSGSHTPDSSGHSPVNRSLFSPQRELHALDTQAREDKEAKEAVEACNESQSSVRFNAVPSSDRSLVIKICTNRNFQFSVTSNNEDAERHDTSKESEENNNAESPSMEGKTTFNALGTERENDNSDRVNDGDSDSDSLKLAVVDSNPDETEEAEETDEVNASGVNGNLSMDVEENGGGQANEVEGTAELDAIEKLDEEANNMNDSEENDARTRAQPNDGIVLAGEDVPFIDLNVDGLLDSIEIESLLKRCIEAASPVCVYCNHARHIAVNGKELGLHMLAEHKFHPQHPAIIIQPEQFIARVKRSLDELDLHFFNLDSYSSATGTCNVPDVRTYECFHCRFHSAVHKELYLHNRKMHQKTILICIMCKSTFYSYSELLCHLCPGTYSPNINVKYRCCLCPMGSLPSAFRLMVHLRKKHHACDVCLESTGNQQRLSNHVWKHKLHHLCYRCGIAYRNKPDITKHLFWKHGTESVLCKKCLQKKWPHIYHFCIPPTAFGCEECGSSFSRAVALKVHKRQHSGDQPYACGECSGRFISRKLLTKHENGHKEQPPVVANSTDSLHQQPATDEDKSGEERTVADDVAAASESAKELKEPVKKVVDVYDLPPLNLSSESDTDSEQEPVELKDSKETEIAKPIEETVDSPANPRPASPAPAADSIVEVEQNEEEKEQSAQIMDGIWDNFKTYTASLQMKESGKDLSAKERDPETDVEYLKSVILADHDYCVVWSSKEKEGESGPKAEEEVNGSGEREDACRPQKSPSGSNGVRSANEADPSRKKAAKSPKKKKQSGSTSSSDSSSDSDSSSCSCGTNCSCSSSSSGSSSSSSSSSDSDSSTSDGSPKKQSSRKERKKEKEAAQESANVRAENNKASAEMENGEAAVPADSVCPSQLLLLRESDLETDETETDEDFYDEHPQQLANKLLAEKRNQLLLLAAVAPASTEVPLNNGLTDAAMPSPDTVAEDQPQKRKVKTKKRKKGERTKQRNAAPAVESIKLNIPKAFYQKNNPAGFSSPATMQQSLVASSPSIIANDALLPVSAIAEARTIGRPGTQNVSGSGSETENKRSSKRKRVPKRFYGDSSDEEADKQPTMKWRKVEATAAFTPVPSLKPLPPRLSFGGKTVAYRPSEGQQQESLRIAAASATESEEPAEESSTDSSDTEVEASQQIRAHLPENNPPLPERPVNLYCYCQCPYDEVSEMIACDGEDCRIEWFHFECVGIMVPPKGKWYCPDCRKKHGIVQNSEDYFD